MTMSFLDRGRTSGATVRTAAPPGSSENAQPRPGIVNEAVGEFGAVMEGRLSLLALDTIIVMLILFYLWTRRAQGGG